MNRHRRAGVTEIVALVGNTQPQIKMTGEQNAVRIIKLGLERVLFTKTAAVVFAETHGGTGSTDRLNRVHRCTGLLERDGCILLVASRYRNHAEPLWNLPGGRQAEGELARDTVVREAFEETAVRAVATDLLYVSESYAHGTHFTNFTFRISSAGEPQAPLDSRDHVTAAEFVPITDLSRITIAVVREPLLDFVRGRLTQRYRGYANAGVFVDLWD